MDQRLKRWFGFLFTMDIWPLWTGLIPKFSVSLLQRQDTTVSLGTKPFICSKKAVFPLSANVIVWKEWARLNYSSKQSLIIKSVGHKIKLSTFTWCLTSKSHHLKTSLRLNSHGLPFRPHFPSTTVSWWTWDCERKKKDVWNFNVVSEKQSEARVYPI